MLMMMIMIAGLVDSVMTPIKSWLDTLVMGDNQHNMTMKEVRSRVDCIVCLSEVGSGETFAMLERCGHGFHVECVEAWLIDHPNCPLCRTPAISCVDQNTRAYLKKSYELMSRYVLETMANWLSVSSSQGLQSSLSESCSYL
ncbi:putative transcription factor C2H2 family [Helianthus anomalus]